MTHRQEIMKLLEKGPVSANSIANTFGLQIKAVLEDLNHIQKTLKTKSEKRLNVIPAHCKKCGFVFREKERIKMPSKCPRCKSEWLEKEKFFIE